MKQWRSAWVVAAREWGWGFRGRTLEGGLGCMKTGRRNAVSILECTVPPLYYV